MLLNAYNTPEIKTFLAPGRIWAGQGLSRKLPEVLPDGPRLLVTDSFFAGHPIVSIWAPEHVIAVSGEPGADRVANEISRIPRVRFSTVIALGGGSAIDTAKAVHAHLSFGSIDVRDKLRPPGAPILAAVPTTAGSGSETSRFFILTENGTKRSRRSWSFVPDLTVLDPEWLAPMPAPLQVLGAFDAFCHLWETFVCRNERSPYTDMLAVTGMPKIAAALTKLNAGERLSPDGRLDLQFASALGGQAISNVRTGLIHTLAESLSPLTELSHPETLWVFYTAVRESYRMHTLDRIERADAALGGPGGLHRLDRLFLQAFERAGLTDRIRIAMAKAQPSLDALMATAMRDSVLLKENPAPANWDDVRAVASRAMSDWRAAA